MSREPKRVAGSASGSGSHSMPGTGVQGGVAYCTKRVR